MNILEASHRVPGTPVRAPWLKRCTVRLASGLSTAVKRVQVARMRAVLNEMSDDHLAAIGVKRRDIPGYAACLIHGSAEWKAR